MPKKLTVEDAQEAAHMRGGVCLSTTYVNKDSKLHWRCSEGHEWWASLHSLRQAKSWCPECAHNKPLTIHDAHRVATARSGFCVSREVAGSRSKLTWKCKKGHQWEALLTSVRQGRWCPYCAGNKPYDIPRLSCLAASKGGVCLATQYVPGQKLRWECAKGHQWDAHVNDINQGSWCPKCPPYTVTTSERVDKLREMCEIAENRGGSCLSSLYLGCQKNLKWECAKGHVWEAKPLNIKHGTWCPRCRENKQEKWARSIFEVICGTPFPKSRPKWLRNSRGNLMELDGYSDVLQIAFEYQGEQHYKREVLRKPTNRRPQQTESEFRWLQQRDQEKRDLCAQHGVTLIEIPWYIEELKNFIKTTLESDGVI